MVKGISRRVVVLDAPDPRFFEQAIFIVRNDAAAEGVSAGELVEEAKRVARECAEHERERPRRVRRDFRALLYALLGASVTAFVWLLTAPT